MGLVILLLWQLFKIKSKNLRNLVKKINNDVDEFTKDLNDYKERLTSVDPKNLNPDELPQLRNDLLNHEATIESLDDASKANIDRYFEILKDLEDLKSDIVKEHEKLIRDLQRKDDDLINKTDKNINDAKSILDDLKPCTQGDSPFLKKYKDKLADLEKQLKDTTKNNDKNKEEMKELLNRKFDDDDCFGFITDLSKDQKILDGKIEDTKLNSDDILKKIKDLKSQFDEEEKNLKDQIALECQRQLNSKLNYLPDIEEKLKKLENGVESSLKTSYLALQVIDKNQQEWNDISKINKDYCQIEKASKELRKDKDSLVLNMHKINQILQNSDLKQMPIEKLLELQNSTKIVYEDFDEISKGIDDETNKLKDLDLKLQNLLILIRNLIKQKADKLTDEIKQRLNDSTRFLRPTGFVSDSVQRPQKLNQLLIDSKFHKEDPDFNQYQKYCDLVSDNLTRCSYATNDLKKLEDNLVLLLDEYSMLQSNSVPVISQIEIYKRLYDKIKSNEKPSIDLHNTIQSILADLNSKKEQEIIDFLNRSKQKRLSEAQDVHYTLGYNIDSLEKKWREVNKENEDFIDVLNKARNTKNKDKLKLIDLLMNESEGSKRDLNKIKQNSEEARKALNLNDPSKAKLEELYPQIILFENYNDLIKRKLEDLNDILNEIIERKKRWNDFITETEIKEKFINELQSLIPQCREKYERMVNSTKFCNDFIIEFYIVNSKIQENHYYETEKAPCANKDKLRLQLSDYESKAEKYSPRVDKFESYDANRLREVDCSDIEQIITEANNLIKLLDADNNNLDAITEYLNKERTEFKDGDIYKNRDKMAKEINNANSMYETLKNKLNSLKSKLESNEVGNINIIKNYKKCQGNIKLIEDTVERSSNTFNEVSAEIDREPMSKAKLITMSGIIEKIGKVIYDLSNIQNKFDEAKQLIDTINADFNLDNYFKKLREANNVNKALLDKLNQFDSLLDKMIEISRQFKEYTSDNEEEKFVKTLEQELLDIKKKEISTKEKSKEIDNQITNMVDLLQTSPLKVDDAKINKLNSDIQDINKEIGQIEAAVNSKAKKFLDMNLYSKFKRRDNEHKNLMNAIGNLENDLNMMKVKCEEDIIGEESEENKLIYSEVLTEIDPLQEKIDKYVQKMDEIRREIDSGILKTKKADLDIDDVFELLIKNIEIKKKLRALCESIERLINSIEDLRNKHPVKSPEIPPIQEISQIPVVRRKYKAVKGDPVDEMIGNWINSNECLIEIHRLGGGFYMFGDKKIYAKIVNGKLIIRVGGGFMNIDEFMKFYGMVELTKQQRLYELEYESVNCDDFVSIDEDAIKDSEKGNVIGIQQAKKNLREYVSDKLNK